MAENALSLTEATFDQHLAQHSELLLVDFWAKWCQPCRMLAPVLDELVREAGGKVILAKVNVDENPALAARYGIRSIPTVLLIKDGKEMDRVIGAVPKGQLQKKLEALV